MPFPGTPDPTRLCIKGGFDPALLYELVRPAKDPFVLGVGNAAMRDVISFFRYKDKDDAGTANPILSGSKTVIGFGNSQSGRFQKHMLNNGFNEDEAGRIVWDGMNPNIAGMMGSFNIRFAQPGDIAELYFPGADGPLWWEDYTDTVRGRPTWGLLHRCRVTNTCPKIMETYGGPEILVQPRIRRHRRHEGHRRPAVAGQRAPLLSRRHHARRRRGRVQPRHGVHQSEPVRGQSQSRSARSTARCTWRWSTG